MAKFRREPIEGQRLRCRCGKLIIIEDKRQTTHHEAPVCEWYKKLIELCGLSERTVTVAPVGPGPDNES